MTEPQLPTVLVARGPGVLAHAVDGDTVVYVEGRDQMILLDPVATQVWDEVATPCRLDELCERLARTFGVDVTQVARDLEEPFDTLVRSGVFTATVSSEA